MVGCNAQKRRLTILERWRLVFNQCCELFRDPFLQTMVHQYRFSSWTVDGDFLKEEATPISQKIVTPDLIRGPDGYGLTGFRISLEQRLRAIFDFSEGTERS